MCSSFLLSSGYTTRVFYIRLFPEGIGLRVDGILAFQVGDTLETNPRLGLHMSSYPEGVNLI